MAHHCSDCGRDAKAGFSRRALLQNSFGGFLGYALARQADLFGAPQPEMLVPQGATRTKGKAVIVLWMGGGPTQFETFSPKEGHANGGPTKAIGTSVKGIKYSQHLSVTARQARHIAVVRSMTSREGSHERGRYLLHTGYIPTGTVMHPAMGSITAMELGIKEHDLPTYITINGPSEGAGFLPPDYNPLILGSPNPGGRRGGNRMPIRNRFAPRGRTPQQGGSSTPQTPIDNLSYPSNVDRRRFRDRMKLLALQEKDFEKEHATPEVTKHKTAYAKADKLMHTPLLSAFDLTKEKPELLKAYGDNNFGKGCLLARRLVQAGVSFVEVNLGGWDTHQDNFERVPQLCRQLDPGMGTLIKDLHDRRMLDNTLVIWMGEFGRTPRINGNQGRDHFPRAWTLAMAGAGIKGGQVIGETDAGGNEVKDRPVTVPDLFATIYQAIGIDHKKKNISPLGRPIQLSDNGVAVKELIG